MENNVFPFNKNKLLIILILKNIWQQFRDD